MDRSPGASSFPRQRGLRPAIFMLALSACATLAHAPGASDGVAASALDAATAWSFEPAVLLPLVASGLLYAWGARALLARTRRGTAAQRWRVAAFALGWTALAIALVSPLDTLGGWLFSAHMVQHEMMMIVAAPLMVLGRPLAAWVWAFGPSGRARLGQAVRRPAVVQAWRWLNAPLIAWSLHAVALWGWHVPAMFGAALRHPAWHFVQHTSFLATALLFWSAVLEHQRQHAASGAAMLALFTTMVHTTALGALLTLAPLPWYPAYGTTTSALGIDLLQDQQLGGLVMWVPGALAYLFAGLAVTARWLRRAALPGGTMPGKAASP
ncbi:MAG: cytochrome c oxidase caa3 assembly factor family protein [Rhodoferax sp.]|nr:cytochrome c oxidase caa3 assembly factor family protein [Rhodoferax sp.]